MTRTRTPAAAPEAPSILLKQHSADLDTGDIDVGVLDKSIELGGTMTIEEMRDALNKGHSPDVDSPEFKNYAETMAYMEEKVLVRVLPSSEPNAEMIVEVWNDGVPQRFVRDQWVVAKRKFVEVLARALPYSVTTPEALDGRGDKTRRIDIHNGQRYPFEMKDPNNASKGAAWLHSLFQGR